MVHHILNTILIMMVSLTVNQDGQELHLIWCMIQLILVGRFQDGLEMEISPKTLMLIYLQEHGINWVLTILGMFRQVRAPHYHYI